MVANDRERWAGRLKIPRPARGVRVRLSVPAPDDLTRKRVPRTSGWTTGISVLAPHTAGTCILSGTGRHRHPPIYCFGDPKEPQSAFSGSWYRSKGVGAI